MTKGNAAIHAARGLLAELGFFHVIMEFIPILNPLDRRVIQRQLTQIFNESGRLSHSIKLKMQN